MAMGTRQSEQGSLWVATAELPKSLGHPFYRMCCKFGGVGW
jgi:hypothetical protein